MKTSVSFRIIDAVLIVMMILPLVFGIVLHVLTAPATEGVSITGARVFFTVPMPLQDFPVTESQVHSVLVTLLILFLSLYLTHGVTEHAGLRRQLVAEWCVEKVDGLVMENMGEYFAGFSPFVISILALSAFSSLLSLFGLYAPTSDINVVGGWSVLVFLLITYYKMKCGVFHYMKSLTEPVPVLTPFNIISEFATPVSMAFRHYGNVLSGAVVSTLIGTALAGLSSRILSALPATLRQIPILRFGLPAVFSVYFDIFSSLLQAFIFAMLTMLYVSGGFPAEDYAKKQARKRLKHKKSSAKV